MNKSEITDEQKTFVEGSALTYPLPNNKKYVILLVDAAWKFITWSEKGKSKSADRHYHTMSLKDIKNLPVGNLADKNSVLFMWVINSMLPQALEVIDVWGFTFKTVAFNWVKTNKKSNSLAWGLGFWTRPNSELCLLATKGKPKRVSASVPQVLISKRREHSRKPDEVRDRIVQLIGDVPRIELFARQRVEGWDAWGDEV
jgi:N6-adenosine-specific RNA methylase IME4